MMKFCYHNKVTQLTHERVTNSVIFHYAIDGRQNMNKELLDFGCFQERNHSCKPTQNASQLFKPRSLNNVISERNNLYPRWEKRTELEGLFRLAMCAERA